MQLFQQHVRSMYIGATISSILTSYIFEAMRVHGCTLNMGYCSRVTDAAFVHLRRIHTLWVYNCNQATITDAAFVHLRGIDSLSMSGCNQRAITDTAFVHLRGIQMLDMYSCNQMFIIDAAFLHCEGFIRSSWAAPGDHHGRSLCAPAWDSIA